jgi:hypothetical protein
MLIDLGGGRGGASDGASAGNDVAVRVSAMGTRSSIGDVGDARDFFFADGDEEARLERPTAHGPRGPTGALGRVSRRRRFGTGKKYAAFLPALNR